MRPLLTFIALGAVACSPQVEPGGQARADTAARGRAAVAQPPTDAPAGEYVLDPSHTSVSFRVSHLGLSRYTARFAKAYGKLAFDPANPAAQAVTATIDAGSLKTDYPDPATLDFDSKVERLFLKAHEHPTIAFRSTRIDLTGPKTARVTGDLMLNGVTKPVTLQTTFNGGYKAGSMDPMGARIGFSAVGTIKRSDFGISYGLPPPGTTFGVGDAIEIAIETEFTSKPG